MEHWTHQIDSNITVVAEVKGFSPFGYQSELDLYEQLAICEELGDVISIHTDNLWGGSWYWLKEARRLTSKPILAKGFHNTIFDVQKAFDYGADYCLTVGWWPGDPRCWHECESLEELGKSRAGMAVWNSRNPRSGEKRVETIADARIYRSRLLLCQASMINKIEDIGSVDMVLIGEGLYK